CGSQYLMKFSCFLLASRASRMASCSVGENLLRASRFNLLGYALFGLGNVSCSEAGEDVYVAVGPDPAFEFGEFLDGCYGFVPFPFNHELLDGDLHHAEGRGLVASWLMGNFRVELVSFFTEYLLEFLPTRDEFALFRGDLDFQLADGLLEGEAIAGHQLCCGSIPGGGCVGLGGQLRLA